MFISTALETVIQELTNMEGFHVYGDEWKKMEDTGLYAYTELLILAGVYRSHGKATSSLGFGVWKSNLLCCSATKSCQDFLKSSMFLELWQAWKTCGRHTSSYRGVWVDCLPYFSWFPLHSVWGSLLRFLPGISLPASLCLVSISTLPPHLQLIILSPHFSQTMKIRSLPYLFHLFVLSFVISHFCALGFRLCLNNNSGRMLGSRHMAWTMKSPH